MNTYENCSLCAISLPYYQLIIPGRCKSHLYCNECYNKIPRSDLKNLIKCLDCKHFFSPSILEDFNYCSHCNNIKDINAEICQGHRMCNECILKPAEKKIKSCYYCLYQWENTCCSCFWFIPTEILACPWHVYHRYCQNCLLENKTNCKKCIINEIRLDTKHCFICNKNDQTFLKAQCKDHSICKRCFTVLLIPNYLNLYRQIYKCKNCINYINKKKSKSFCALCLKNKKKLFKNLACPSGHEFCKSCFANKKNEAEFFSCRYCIEYFFPKNDDAYCLLCTKFRNNYISTSCDMHNICTLCFDYILKNHPKEYIKSFSCKTCSQSLKKQLKTILKKNYIHKRSSTTKLLFENTSKIESEHSCSLCNAQYHMLIPSCSSHNICPKCYKNKTDQIINLNCHQCSEAIKLSCNNCKKKIKNEDFIYENLACIYSHLYCKNCFILPEKYTNENSCKLCLKIYENTSLDKCLLCKNSTENCEKCLCENHSICKKCFKILNNENKFVYASVFPCWACGDSLKSINFSYYPNNLNARTENIEEEKKLPLNIEIINLSEICLSEPEKPLSVCPNSDLIETPLKTDKNPFNNKLFLSHFSSMSTECKVEESESTERKNSLTQSSKNIAYLLSTSIKKLIISGIANLSATNEIAKKSECCCNDLHYNLECGHSLCPLCLENSFKKKYQKFIENIKFRNLKELNEEVGGINCHKEDCYCKLAVPFSVFYECAKEVALSLNIDEKFVKHYELFFEGIRYKFESFNCCGYITGYLFERKCMWCN